MAEQPERDATLNEIRDMLRRTLSERTVRDARFEFVLKRLTEIERDVTDIKNLLLDITSDPENEAVLDAAQRSIDETDSPSDLPWERWRKGDPDPKA